MAGTHMLLHRVQHVRHQDDWGMKPLAKYTMRNKEPLSVKGLVQVDAVHQYFVHEVRWCTS